jgi:hypothetical protein
MSKLGVIKLAWLVLALLITVPLVVTYNPTTNRDNDILLVYALLTLTFPSGFAVAALYGVIGYTLERLFSTELPVGRLAMIVDTVVFLSAGYLQWFVILPAVGRFLKRNSATNS